MATKSNLKRVTPELSRKSPLVVFKDADLDYAVEFSHTALVFNNGQVCTAGFRTYVQEDIYDEYVKRATERVKTKSIGYPYGPKNEIDAIKQFERVPELIESGNRKGSKLSCGGAKQGITGFFIGPTVFSDDNEKMSGPAHQIAKFKDLDEVIEKVNDKEYGLSAACFTKDLETALNFSRVQAGSVWVNCYHAASMHAPFGGF